MRQPLSLSFQLDREKLLLSILISAELSRINKGRCRQSRWFVTEHGAGRKTVQLFIAYNGLSLHLAIHHHIIPEINWACAIYVKYPNVTASLEYSGRRSFGSGWEHPHKSFLRAGVSSLFGNPCGGCLSRLGQGSSAVPRLRLSSAVWQMWQSG